MQDTVLNARVTDNKRLKNNDSVMAELMFNDALLMFKKIGLQEKALIYNGAFANFDGANIPVLFDFKLPI